MSTRRMSMNRTKWLLVCLSLFLGLVGCSAKTDRQVEKIIDKEHLTNEEKQLVKDSMLIEYVKDTYGNIVQPELFTAFLK